MAHVTPRQDHGYRKITAGGVGGSLAALVGWYVRTKLPGWEDFPTEHLTVAITGVIFYLVPEKAHG
jgi:hypothetical protein